MYRGIGVYYFNAPLLVSRVTVPRTLNNTDMSNTFNIASLATQAPTEAKDLAKINIEECIHGTITNVQPMAPINGKPICRIYVDCPKFKTRFNALLDGTLAEVLSFKNSEITLIFRGINSTTKGDYPRFSTMF